jgi:hypothetical protein
MSDRKSYSDETKEEAIKMVKVQGLSQVEVSKGSSAESVGGFRLRESAKCMIQGNFYSFEATKPIGFSGNQFFGSSAESVGGFRLRESAKCMIQGNFYSFEGTKPIGFSGNQFFFVVETLYRAQ